jgi:hypothetical protein
MELLGKTAAGQIPGGRRIAVRREFGVERKT